MRLSQNLLCPYDKAEQHSLEPPNTWKLTFQINFYSNHFFALHLEDSSEQKKISKEKDLDYWSFLLL